jgi:hypothetical protein
MTMKMGRRDLLKTLGVTTVAATFGQTLPAVALAQATAQPTTKEQAPERLLQAEPAVSLNADGEATLEWETVVPTQGATIYLGLPNDSMCGPTSIDLPRACW